MNTTAFGSRLRELREQKNISLRELAKKINVSGAFLSDIELGRRFPSPDKIELLAKEIGVPVDDLRQYDFRDEAEAIRKMMFADPQAGMAFRTLKDKLTSGSNPQEIVKKLTKDKK
jgi:transcriptional regulator with XRE-family HTH domain